jgi:hypothetical protein
MSIAVTCPSGHLLKIADNMAGRAGRCPICREIVNVPALRRSADADQSTLAGGSRLGRGPANPAAPPSNVSPVKTPPTKTPPSDAPPAAVSPDPAAADTVLMPLSLGDMPMPDDFPFAGQQSAAEPESPVMAEPDLMAQTLPLPTAELIPKRSAGAPDPAHEIGFDTAGHKGKIVGSWKVLGDVEPPYIPESALKRGAGAAVGTTSALVQTSPPLPAVRPTVSTTGNKKGDILVFQKSRMSPFFVRATVYRIAAGLVFVSVFSMWPALRYWDLGVAPGWARGVLLVAILQLAYAAWLVSIPDWASLWSTMFVLAIVATLYGTAAAMTLATPMEHEPPLGLQSVRHAAPGWCFCVMLLTISAAYLCGHAAQRIRRIAQQS